jgi:hypothetical protein
MMNKLKNLLFALGGLVPCKGVDDPNFVGPIAPGTGACDWSSLFALGQNILTWLIWVSIPVATIAIAYAGWLMIWGSTKPGEIERGKTILRSTLIGLATVLAAALIVKAILSYLTDPAFGLKDFIQ